MKLCYCQAAKAEGKTEGKVIGKAMGKAMGKAEAYREVAAWDRRRREAAARGEEFTEPLPGTPQNESESHGTF